MKCAEKTFDMFSDFWSNDKLHNANDKDLKKEKDAKYKAFCNKKIEQLLLVDQKSGRQTILKLPHNDKPLKWYFE